MKPIGKEKYIERVMGSRSMKKVIRVFLFTDDLRIIDTVFAYTLKRNIVDTDCIELIRKRDKDNLNSILPYDLVITDDAVSDSDLSELENNESFPSILRVVPRSEILCMNINNKSQNLEFSNLKIKLHEYLDILASQLP